MAEPQRGAGAPIWPLSPYQINVQPAAGGGAASRGSSASIGIASTGIARGQITRGDGADWFGPLNPLNPVAPPDIAGRRFDFPVGYNLVVRPRAYEPIGFHELRGFADAYDLLRLVIETRKDQMERQRWRIRPRDPKFKRKSAAIDADMTARIATCEKFLHKPDGITRWKTWLRALLEDMFVIDAATLYCQRARSGQLVALAQLDGATIKRLIDDWGRTPQPYAGPDGATVYPPAYQQVLKGLPAVNYAARDIIYRPRNVRAHRVYGYSPVQQILMTVNIALRRQLWQLDYYAEGSIPDALIGVPQGWTPDQIKQFQDYWDQEFAGDLARRRRAKFVPGESAARVHQTKEPEQKNDFDEWLARIVCFAFSVPPQWAVKAMNRATADNQSAQAEEEGLEPTKEWVKDLVDELLAEEFASPDLELTWLDEDTDEKTEQAQFEARVKIGAATLNEFRDSLGLDPFDTSAADRPMVLTATGYVPIETNVGGQGTGALGATDNASARAVPKASRQNTTLVQKYNPDQPRVPVGNPDGGQWTAEGEDSQSIGSNDVSDNPIDQRETLGTQYAALDTGTRTDATDVPSGETKIKPQTVGAADSSGRDLWQRLKDLIPMSRRYNVIGASDIPDDHPKHPVTFLDSSGRPILDDEGKPILRPADLQPERYAAEGAASHLAEYVRIYNEAMRTELNEPSEENERALVSVLPKIAQELVRFTHGGSLDAERFDLSYVRDYRHYTSIATGIFMAAAGLSREDALGFADSYAHAAANFRASEPRDQIFGSSAKRDIEDNLRGYDLYESGRIRVEK